MTETATVYKHGHEFSAEFFSYATWFDKRSYKYEAISNFMMAELWKSTH